MEKIIKLENNHEAQLLMGSHDENIKLIEKEIKVRITLREGNIKIRGNSIAVKKTTNLIYYVLDSVRLKNVGITIAELQNLINNSSSDKYSRPQASHIPVLHGSSIKVIQPKTKGQRDYVEAIKQYDITFGIGPAGTGKTYLAMACAVEALKNQQVRRIILTRPAIEAGESLGFLPGDMYEKISPYLRPLYDALYDMMEAERIERYIETGIIEVAPLAYMRGRTLNDAFIILDEAQNATAEQMKMFLTRLGFESKAVITGDVTQTDLPGGKPIGLIQAQNILKGIEDIKFSYFTGADVVRHELVQKIIEAYEKTSKPAV